MQLKEESLFRSVKLDKNTSKTTCTIRQKTFFVLLFTALGAGFYLGGYTDTPKKATEVLASEIFSTQGISNFIKGKQSRPLKLTIDIRHKHYQRLEYNRQQALQKGIIVTEEDSYVPAKLSTNGKMYSVKLRLKGDYTDHLEGKKWSLRVHVKGNNTILGMKRFSLQAPERSGYIKEWIFHQWMRFEDLIGLRYDFVEVVLNGEGLGIFALEESFSKELLEFNHRREAPILKFDEAALIDNTKTSKGEQSKQADIFFGSDILSFTTTKLLEKPALTANFTAAREMLNDFRSGKRSLADTFDMERTARLFAVLDILLGQHAIRWKNIRFYYNPVTNKIEPMAYNMYPPGNKFLLPAQIYYRAWQDKAVGQFFVFKWIDRFFSDKEFQKRYFSELNRITAPGYLESFFASIEPLLEAKKNIIYKDGPLTLPKKEWYFRARDLQRQFLQPKAPIKAYLESAKDEHLNLTIANNSFLPITLTSLECKTNKKVYQKFSKNLLTGKKSNAPLKFQSIKISEFSLKDRRCLEQVERLGDNLVQTNLRLRYQIPGTESIRTAAIDAHPIKKTRTEYHTEKKILEALKLYEKEKRLSIDYIKKLITIESGTWKIKQDLVFPANFKVIGKPGTTLELTNRASVISYSPLTLEGSSEKPFSLIANNGQGQGLLVIGAKGPSLLRHVTISGQSALARPNWTITGAVTFYESDLKISKCLFEKNESEDLLNIIRSKFLIEDSTFSETPSDAIDVDFGNGTIVKSKFKRCGNDCLDFSGSKSKLNSIKILSAGDKGISIGEKSNLTLKDISITDTEIGLAGKDSSIIKANNITINKSRVGLAAYQKKPEFSGAVIISGNLKFRHIFLLFLRDRPSRIQHNGKIAAETPEDLLNQVNFGEWK